MIHSTLKNNRGLLLLNVIVFGSIATIIIVGLTSWAVVTLRGTQDLEKRELAFHIAESGVEYYRWHLAHDSDDYQDGTGSSGPYIHEFFDKEGEKIGEYSLDITPPPIGSTLVTIESTGILEEDDSITRTIRTQLAIPSFAKFAVVADNDIRLGEGTEVFGPVHSNGGVRFDGFAHNIVSSARDVYDDPDHSGTNEFGVHTHISPTDPNPPSSVPPRPDVFEVGREFPVPAVDFEGLISDLASIKIKAQEPEGQYFAASGALGYHITLKTDDTFDLYQVTSMASPSSSCNSRGQSGWGTWSIGDETFIDNYDNPTNGLIFAEDHLWVDGQIDGARLTIVAAQFPDIPAKRRNITINNDLTYTSYDGTDVIALIAQDNVNIGLISEDNLQIDGALISQNGRVGSYYYRPPFNWGGSYYPGCSPYNEKDTITLNGMIGTKNRYGFSYTDGTGYETRNINYDVNLLYNPPPYFPLTSEQYETISWEEIEN